MRVLWVANLVSAAGSSGARPDLATFGGWIAAMLAQLAKVPGLTLGLAVRSDCREMRTTVVDGVKTYFLPVGRDPMDISASDAEAVLADFAPDLLHAEGTEMAYTRRFLRAWHGPNIVSMQGVMSGLEPYEYGGLRIDQLLGGGVTEKLFGLALMYAKRFRFMPRLCSEADSFALAQNLIGRTRWDRAWAYRLRPDVPYFTVHRILRPPFYTTQWDLKSCERHSLFVGNASVVRKGAHFVLHAMAQLRREYPDIKLYVAGDPPFPDGGSRRIQKAVGYPAYLRWLIKRLDLGSSVVFTGVLDAREMAERMAGSHVYVLSSLIENSPNTLAEAMAVGAPVVTAFAGGAASMAEPEKEALFYRPEDPAELAWQIRRVFKDDALALSLSQRARKRAQSTHDPHENRDRLLKAYRTVLASKEPVEATA